MQPLDTFAEMDLKDYLYKLRMDAKLNQEDFAKPLKVTSVHVSRIERGKALPSESLIDRVGKHYGADTHFMKKEVARIKAEKVYTQSGMSASHQKANEPIYQHGLTNRQKAMLEMIVELTNKPDHETALYIDLIFDIMKKVHIDVDGILKRYR